MKRALALLIPALVALATLAPAPAAAQSAKDIAAAKQAFREGEDAEAKGDLATALARFNAALAVKATAQLHLRVGAVEERMGKLLDALASYQRGLEKAGALPAVAKVAREQIEALKPRIPTLTVVAKTVPGLAITLDDAPLPAAALGSATRLDPGPHRLHAEAPGYAPSDRAFTSAERGGTRVDLDLAPAAAPPSPEAGPSKVPGAVLTAAGGAALVAGAALIGLSVAKDASIDALCGGSARDRCPLSKKAQIDADLHAVNGMRFGGIGAAVLGLGGAAAGVVLLVRAARGEPAAAQVGVVPIVGAGTAGLSVSGRF